MYYYYILKCILFPMSPFNWKKNNKNLPPYNQSEIDLTEIN